MKSLFLHFRPFFRLLPGLWLGLLATGLACSAQGQPSGQPAPALPDEEPFEMLFKRRANRQTSALKGYGALLSEFSPAVGGGNVKSFLNTGIEGGVLVNRRLRLGAYLLSAQAPVFILKQNPFTAEQDAQAVYAQLGGTVAWLPRAERAVHVVLGARLGYGAGVVSYFDPPGQQEDLAVEINSGVLLTPFADVEMNLRPWLRVNLGAGYRLATGENNRYFEHGRDFSGPVLQFGIQFGNFK